MNVEWPGSIDSIFRLLISPKGEVWLDTYEEDVVKCENARLCLDIQYKHLIENFLKVCFFPIQSVMWQAVLLLSVNSRVSLTPKRPGL